MNAFQAILLGLIQGLCEFLPVSSSGHLVLFQQILGVDDPGILLDTLLHVGTLIAIFVVFWRDIWAMLKKPLSKPVYLLVIATVPAVIATVLLGDFFELAFTGAFLGVGFLITSIILLVSGKKQGAAREMGYVDALVISQEEGISKPDARIVERALERLGCTDKAQAVIVGDSLSSDMLAAKNARVDGIWYNPQGMENPGDNEYIKAEIKELHELVRFVHKEDE